MYIYICTSIYVYTYVHLYMYIHILGAGCAGVVWGNAGLAEFSGCRTNDVSARACGESGKGNYFPIVCIANSMYG